MKNFEPPLYEPVAFETTTEQRLIPVESEAPTPDPIPRRWVAAQPQQIDREAAYKQLGNVRDPLLRESARQRLADPGLRAARWLIERAEHEVDAERLHDVADILGRLEQISIVPILDALRSGATSDQAWMLFKALGWMSNFPKRFSQNFRSILLGYLDCEDPDLREAGASALAAALGRDAADEINIRVGLEQDDHVREHLEDILKKITT